MTAAPEMAEFLNEDFLRKLEQLRILAQRGIKGPARGEHRSWRSGGTLEFLDHRRYQAGDDFRYVDWNVYGRLDRLFLKLFQSEEDLTVHLLLDMSRSMAAGRPPKFLHALRIAAALAYIALANLDRVGLYTFDERLREGRPPERGRQAYAGLIRDLIGLRAEGLTDLSACLSAYAQSVRRPGVVVILSDLMDPKGCEAGLAALAQRRFDVALIQVLDAEELAPTATGLLTLKEVETGQTRKLTLDRDLLEAYRHRVEEWLAGIREACLKIGADYALAETRLPFEDFLLGYLGTGRIFGRKRR
jgi:uncharacterized protein (DUF58 family)